MLRRLLATCTSHRWALTNLAVDRGAESEVLEEFLDGGTRRSQRQVSISLALTGKDVANAASLLAAVDGVSRVDRADDDSE